MLSSPSVINNFTTTTALLCQYFHPTSLFFFFPLLSPCFESRELENAQRAPLFARAHLHPPRNYLAYLPTEAVLRGIHSRRFKLQNCIPKKEGKLHREDSKRNAKEVSGERRRSNKRMQFTKRKGGGSCALYYKLYSRGTSLESFNCVTSEPLSRVPTINLEICLLSVEVRFVQMPLDEDPSKGSW